jgi:hypothetical protein
LRRIKVDAKRINDALSQGIDPYTMTIDDFAGHQGEVAIRGGKANGRGN